MKKFFQKIAFKIYMKKIESLRNNPNPNGILHAMDRGILRQEILTAVFVGHITMAQARELMAEWEKR